MSDQQNIMPVLPQNIEAYSKTKVFTHETVPAGLQSNHSTKAGTWGVLHIVSGELQYHITEEGSEAQFELNKEFNGIIKPEQIHHIVVSGPVEFYVEFCREVDEA